MLNFFLTLIVIFFLSGCSKENEITEFDYKYERIDSLHVLFTLYDNLNNSFEIDTSGNFYFTHSTENLISKYSHEGDLIKKVGGIGKGPGEYEEDKIIIIELNAGLLLAHTYGGVIINMYNLELELLNSITTEDLVVSAKSLGSNYLLTYYLNDQNNFIEIKNAEFEVVTSINSLVTERNKFYRNLYKIIILDDEEYLVSYLAINKILKLSVGTHEPETEFIIPGIKQYSPSNKELPGGPPTSLLIRDIIYNSLTEELYVVEGNHERNDGSNRIHVISIDGSYKKTYLLPVKIDLIGIYTQTLYGLSFVNGEVKVIKIGKLK